MSWRIIGTHIKLPWKANIQCPIHIRQKPKVGLDWRGRGKKSKEGNDIYDDQKHNMAFKSKYLYQFLVKRGQNFWAWVDPLALFVQCPKVNILQRDLTIEDRHKRQKRVSKDKTKQDLEKRKCLRNWDRDENTIKWQRAGWEKFGEEEMQLIWYHDLWGGGEMGFKRNDNNEWRMT